MTTLAVITPTYEPDFELFKDLHRSLREFTAPSVVHYAITPRRDIELFSSLRSDRLVVWPEEDLLPRRLVALPRTNARINVHRPFPPVRGWVLQQLIKLAAAGRLEADAVLLVDSDVSFVGTLEPEQFVRNGITRLYREPAGVTRNLPRHIKWHEAARRLLGLPEAEPPLPDYVTSFNVWDPKIVRELHGRLEDTTGRPWSDAVGAQLHFSEWTLYGIFVDEVLGAPANSFSADTSLCHSYWDPSPLLPADADRFVRSIGPADVAIMISAKSRTPINVRREALAGLVHND